MRWARSFTLVEMIVAIAISSIIFIVLLAMTSSLLTSWQAGQAKDERRAAAQLVFDRMTRDLRQMTLPSSTYNTNSLEFVINPNPVGTNYDFPQSVFWQAPVITDGGTAGNLAIVGYFVQWVNGVPNLSRLLINPSSPSYSIYSTPANWINTPLIAANAPATAPGYPGLMANNILGLWIQALDPNGKPIQQTATSLAGENFDSRLSYSYTNSVYPTIASTNAPPTLPAAVQIAILVIDSRTAKHLTGTEMPTTNQLTGNFWGDIQSFYTSLPAIIQKGAEIRTTTVDLSNSPR